MLGEMKDSIVCQQANDHMDLETGAINDERQTTLNFTKALAASVSRSRAASYHPRRAGNQKDVTAI